eukprot:4710232-Pleurochrysis_carterae.AAC.1
MPTARKPKRGPHVSTRRPRTYDRPFYAHLRTYATGPRSFAHASVARTTKLRVPDCARLRRRKI